MGKWNRVEPASWLDLGEMSSHWGTFPTLDLGDDEASRGLERVKPPSSASSSQFPSLFLIKLPHYLVLDVPILSTSTFLIAAFTNVIVEVVRVVVLLHCCTDDSNTASRFHDHQQVQGVRKLVAVGVG